MALETTHDYFDALVARRLRRPRGAGDLFAKIRCMGCGVQLVFDALDLESPELDPGWPFCDRCRAEAESPLEAPGG